MTHSSQAPFLTCELVDEAATIRFAQDVAAAVLPGDLVALEGDLGAGKTAFSRALIRALAKDSDLEVPSPTFSILQPYDELRIPVRHFDLYRMSDPEELEELGFYEDLDTVVTLVEWPDNAGNALPPNHITLEIDILAGDLREVRLIVGEDQSVRFRRTFAARYFLEEANYQNAERAHVQGDASHRTYERIAAKGQASAIFMNAPETPPGEIIQHGKSYAELVHRAVDTKPFEAVGKLLLRHGLSAPDIYAANHEDGFMLLEDLGSAGMLDGNGAPIRERMLTAIDALASLHNAAGNMAQSIPGVGGPYEVPAFDRTAFLTEVSLFADWFVPHQNRALSSDAKSSYVGIWSDLFDVLKNAENGFILRDVHSPNLLWLENRKGIKRVGLLDFQDALWGPQIYDLASLVYDARATISAQLREELLARYMQSRNKSLEIEELNVHLCIVAAQRTAKVLGIFARLADRDSKLSYLAHMSRNEAYLNVLLKNPILEPLVQWNEVHLPPR